MNKICIVKPSLKAFGLSAAMLIGAAISAPAQAADTSKSGYEGVPRTWLWNPSFNEMVDTEKWKKDGPYVIGFSNASISNA